MSELSKDYIKRSFDKASNYYSQFSQLQETIALELVKNLDGYFKNVLEIGVGDGKLIKCLKIKFDNYIGIDISFNMAKTFQQSTALHSVVCDAENLAFKEHSFDLILSSSCFQWFYKPESSILDIIKLLKSKGKLMFSAFAFGTFSYMNHIRELTGFGSVLELKDESFYKKILKNYNSNIYTKHYIVYFDSIVDFLKMHKKSGARYTNTTTLCAKSRYFEFCRLYEKLYKTPQGIPVNYSILYGEVNV